MGVSRKVVVADLDEAKDALGDAEGMFDPTPDFGLDAVTGRSIPLMMLW